MPWSTTTYCSRADVKAALDLTTTADDSWIDELIDEAQNLIDEELGYRHQTITETRYYDGNGLDFLMVGDIQSFTNVTEGGVDITSRCYLGPYNASDSQPYKLVKTGTDVGGNRFGSEFSEGRRNISVTGTFGRSTVPSWVKRITIRLVVHWYKMRDSNYADAMTSQGGNKLIYRKELPKDVREVLDFKARRGFRARS
jgi:hypothetical protein